MDTTIDAAAFFPDLISLPRYLADPSKRFVFFADDKTNLSVSFGAYKSTVLQPTYVTITGSLTREPPKTADVATLSLTRELRCRGGPEGLAFSSGTSAGANLMKMALAYRVASVEFGATGRGIGPGMCAWVQRDAGGAGAEPGRIQFTTSANAQLNQTKSGSAVDRTPTAAERWPDVNTIPAYMRDANHYWTFTVARTEPTVARTNAAWKASVTDIVTGGLPSQNPKGVSKPDVPEARPIDAPGARRTGSDAVPAALGIRDVSVTPGLQAVAIRFTTASDANVAVSVSTAPPSGAPGKYQFASGIPLVVKRNRTGNVWQYTTYSQTTLPMNTHHWFLISMGGTYTKIDQRTGEFTTKNQTVIVHFERMHILNDSDKDSDGELSFRFFAGPSTEVEPCVGRAYQSDCFDRGFDGRAWGSGSTHSLANTIRMPTAPNRIRVWVKGWDVDDVRTDTRYASSPVGPGGAGGRYGVGGGSDMYSDYNTASAEFNVGMSPEKPRLTILFKLRSVDGSVFMFEVEGEIEIIRQ
jgi:hypothetical protein